GVWYLFFFSSRRRHTRSDRDWSSDVCSSDLDRCVDDLEAVIESSKISRFILFGATIGGITALAYAARHPERVTHLVIVGGFSARSEERRVGKECRSGGVGWS